MNNDVINNLIEYITELKERETKEERLYFWKNVIGMTDDDIKNFDLDYED